MSQHAENSRILIWFRQDLRLADNPALAVACQTGKIVPVYILDDTNSSDAAMGGASRWWLHQSLRSLSKDLQGKLVVLAGDPQTLLPELATGFGVPSSSASWALSATMLALSVMLLGYPRHVEPLLRTLAHNTR